MLKITKKGDKYWLFEDSEIGLFSPSKFTINLLNNVITIVYENGLKSKRYNVSDCEIYDLGATSPFTTSSGDLFMQKLEELNCPCFQKNENIFNISGGEWGDITGTLSDQTDLQTALDSKLNKDTTSGVERAYIINADGSQGTKATSEFKDVLEFANLASFPATGETGKIYLALDTNKTYRWSGSAYVQIGGTTKKTENLFFQDAIGQTPRTITADQKNMHQSRYLANASPYGVLGLTLGNGVTEVGGVINLAYLSDVIAPQITGDYVGKVKKIVFSYSRNVNESSANTNVMIRVMADTKYMTDMQLICQHNLVSTTTVAFAENKVELPILTHLPLSAFSNIGWCIRSNNATAQQFVTIRLNVIVEEI